MSKKASNPNSQPLPFPPAFKSDAVRHREDDTNFQQEHEEQIAALDNKSGPVKGGR
jgi:hypothetical protein